MDMSLGQRLKDPARASEKWVAVTRGIQYHKYFSKVDKKQAGHATFVMTHFFGLVSFLCCAYWCILTYVTDKDICLVDLKLYNDNPNHLYPSISILLINPFLDDKLKVYGEGINAITYSSFLAGQHWDERMLYIDYDNVTIDLNEYFIGYEMLSDNFSVISINNFTDNPATSYGWKKLYKNFRSHGLQTYEVDPPFDTYGGVTKFLVQTWIKIKTDLFKNSLRQDLYEYNPQSPNWGGFEVWLTTQISFWNHGISEWENGSGHTEKQILLKTIKWFLREAKWTFYREEINEIQIALKTRKIMISM